MDFEVPVEELFQEWRATGREELREQIIQQALPLAFRLARRFAYRGEPLEDLEGQAMLGLIKAVDRYDPQSQVKFITYATHTIMGELRRYFRDHGWAIKVPRRLQDLVLEIREAEQELEQTLGRSPTVAELADALQVREEDILNALEASSGYTTLSWEGELSPEEEEEEGSSLGDFIGAEDDSLERYLTRQALLEAVKHLEERERYIIERRYLLDEASQAEVAKELGISQMHVSRLERRAIEKIRRFLQEGE